MADNRTVDNNALTDYIVATDEVTYSGDASSNIQLMRLVHVTGTEGSKTVSEIIQAVDAAYTAGDFGLMSLGVRNDANAARGGTDGDYVPMATDAVGRVRTLREADLLKKSATSSGLTTATTSYTAGDQVGTQFTFSNMARASGGGGIIVAANLISAADNIGPYDLLLFDSSVTPAADNAAFAISDADSLKFVAYIQLAGAWDIGNNRVACAQNLAIPYVTSGGTSLYGLLITRYAHTFFGAATDLQIDLYIERY